MVEGDGDTIYWIKYYDIKSAEETTGEPVVVSLYYISVEKKQQVTNVNFYYDDNDKVADYDAERDKIIKSITID